LYSATRTGAGLRGITYLGVTPDRRLVLKAHTKLFHGKALRTHGRLYSPYKKADTVLAKALMRSILTMPVEDAGRSLQLHSEAPDSSEQSCPLEQVASVLHWFFQIATQSGGYEEYYLLLYREIVKSRTSH
jgi:hypothetical protein